MFYHHFILFPLKLSSNLYKGGYMKSSQHLKCCFLAFISCILVTFITAKFFGVTVPTALASTNQAGIFTDSTPSLFIYPTSLNEQNCQTTNNKKWPCVVTFVAATLPPNPAFWNPYPS